MKNIDPIPHLRGDGGADFKEKGCPLICYKENRLGDQEYQCVFLRVVPSYPIEEFKCADPGGD